jgi:hypothetical protein
MTILPVAASRGYSPSELSASRTNAANAVGSAAQTKPTTHTAEAARAGETAADDRGERPSSGYLIRAAATSPRAFTTPTLPPGVAFVEEPSGIKIYVGNEQVTRDPKTAT